MTQPTNNMSLKGICDWAEALVSGDGGKRQNPPGNQNINADMVDGMHYTDLKADWEAYADTHGGGGGGVVAMGTANFAGNGGYVTVNIGKTMPNTDYMAYVVPSADTDSRVGEYWVPEANKGTTSFRVYNDGSATTQFKWAVATKSSGTGGGNTAGGDLSGTYPDPTVAKIQGIPVSTTDPTDGQVLKYNGTTGKWEPAADATGGESGRTVLDTPGSGTFQVPTGVTSLKVFVGGGGGGGTFGAAFGGGGGGGGGACIHQAYTVSPGQIINYTVGSGGVGRYYSGGWIDATSGTASSFGSMSAGGGTAATSLSGSGGSGGSASGGQINLSGGTGADGLEGNIGGYGGCGGGGGVGDQYSTGNGTNGGAGAYGSGGGGGVRSIGTADGSGGANGTYAITSPSSGKQYSTVWLGGVGGQAGGGGGAGYGSLSAVSNTGGNGGNGAIIVAWGIEEL